MRASDFGMARYQLLQGCGQAEGPILRALQAGAGGVAASAVPARRLSQGTGAEPWRPSSVCLQQTEPKVRMHVFCPVGTTVLSWRGNGRRRCGPGRSWICRGTCWANTVVLLSTRSASGRAWDWLQRIRSMWWRLTLARNALIVGPKAALLGRELLAEEVHFVAGHASAAAHSRHGQDSLQGTRGCSHTDSFTWSEGQGDLCWIPSQPSRLARGLSSIRTK